MEAQKAAKAKAEAEIKAREETIGKHKRETPNLIRMLKETKNPQFIQYANNLERGLRTLNQRSFPGFDQLAKEANENFSKWYAGLTPQARMTYDFTVMPAIEIGSPVQMPQLLRRLPKQYSVGLQGKVTVKAEFDSTGRVKKITILSSSPNFCMTIEKGNNVTQCDKQESEKMLMAYLGNVRLTNPEDFNSEITFPIQFV